MNNITIANMDESKILEAMIAAYNSGNGSFTIICPDGKTASVKAFEYKSNHEDCEWFFVDGIDEPYASDESLMKLANYFAHYNEAMAERKDKLRALMLREKELAAISDKDSDEYRDLYDFYSDCYKDLHGRRPRRII